MSELGLLFQHVKTAIAAEDASIEVAFGRREVSKQINLGGRRSGRIVLHEGAPDGDIGEEVAPRWPGTEPRPLKDELEKFTVYIWGHDNVHPQDELKQHDAAWALYCAWRRIVFKKAEGRAAQLSKRWKSPQRIERAFGKEIEVVCTIRSQVLDVPLVIVEGVASTTTLTGLDETEVVTTEGTT